MDYMSFRNCTGMVHKVKTGETMYHLSRMYKVSIDELIAANPGVNVYNMQTGDEVCIPVPAETMESQNIKEDFYELVKRFDK